MSDYYMLKAWGLEGRSFDERFGVSFIYDMLDEVYADYCSDTITTDLQAGNTCESSHQEGASKMTNANGMMGAMGALMNPQKIMDRMFKKVDNVVWDMMTGNVGFAGKDGIVTLEIDKTDPANLTFQPVINPIDGMGMQLPAFAQQTALDNINIGDMIVQDRTHGWVTEKHAKSLKIIRPDGSHSTFTPPKTQILDLGSGVMVVRNMMNMLPNGQAGATSIMQSMMQMQMMSQFMGADSDFDMSEMLPMMLMMQGAGQTSGVADQANNPMAAFGANMQQMLPMMLMGKMMGNKSGDRRGIPSFNR